jgi:RND family efflux transporter MFP subunit
MKSYPIHHYTTQQTLLMSSKKIQTFVITMIWLLPFYIFTSCVKSGEHTHASHEPEGVEHEEDHENEKIASLTNKQMESINIQLGSIEKKQLTASLRANGILKVPNQNRAFATTLLGGIVKSLLVQAGSSVQKGQTIATITNMSFITLQEDYLQVSSDLELAEIELTRQRELQEGNAGSVKAVQQADKALKTLKTKKASLQRQLDLIGINTDKLSNSNIQTTVNINTPIAGVVSDVLVNIGSYVDPNNPIAEIVDNSQLHLDLYVYEKDLSKLKVGQTIHFTLTNNPGKEYDATIFAISNTFEEETKAVAVHAQVKGNKTNLIDGMSITALISLNNILLDAVPTDAIVNYQGQDYIFIVKENVVAPDHQGEEVSSIPHGEPGHTHETTPAADHSDGKEMSFERIPVRKGTTDVGYSEITLLDEIPVNAKIVTNGAFFILAKLTNQGEAHEH